MPPQQGAPPPDQPQQAPPPQKSWQSQAQQPGRPPGGQQQGGQAGGGMPNWTSNITASNTISGPAGMTLASIPDRIIAIVIDAIILGVIGFIVGAIIHPILGERITFLGTEVGTGPSLLSSIVVVLIMLAVTAGYFIYMWMRMDGATVGMRVLKLRLADAAGGGPVSQQQAINRWLLLGAPLALSFFYAWAIGLIISLAVLAYFIYLLVTTAQSPTRQGFHDNYANTVVTKAA